MSKEKKETILMRKIFIELKQSFVLVSVCKTTENNGVATAYSQAQFGPPSSPCNTLQSRALSPWSPSKQDWAKCVKCICAFLTRD